MNLENDGADDSTLFKSENCHIKLVLISEIKDKDRVRKDLGDIEALGRSITEFGLLQPIVITSENHLLAGERRLCAAKLLGWNEIPALVIEIGKSV